MSMIEPDEETQVFIDRVLAKTGELNQAQKLRLRELAGQYKHLGEMAVAIVYDAIMDIDDHWQKSADQMQYTMAQILNPDRDEDEEGRPMIIDGNAIAVNGSDDLVFEDDFEEDE